jgi:hypothetical protein
MKLIVLSMYLWTVLLSCATYPQEDRTNPNIHPSVMPYVLMFMEDGNLLISGELTIQIVKKFNYEGSKNPIGLCWPTRQKVQLLASAWAQFNMVQRKLLVYHELGHCVLGRLEHIDILLANGCAQSLMHSTHLHNMDECYRDDPDYYNNELFNGGWQ